MAMPPFTRSSLTPPDGHSEHFSYHHKYLEGAPPLEGQDSQRDAAWQERLRTAAIAPKQQ